MVTTRRRGIDPSAQAATQAIHLGGNRALKKFLGVAPKPKPQPRPPTRPAPPPPTQCGAERERIRVLERAVAELKAGRATAVRRAMDRAAPREQARQVNWYSSPGMGLKQWENMGPAWASLKYAREMAVKNRPVGAPAFRPPPPRFTKRT